MAPGHPFGFSPIIRYADGGPPPPGYDVSMGTDTSEKNAMRTIRVLIVDDCPVVRDGLTSLLKTSPVMRIVGEASDGGEALKSVARLRPDVVLVDAQMPGLDGVDTTRRIKVRWPEVKVLFLTVHSSYIDDARAAGADGHLMKDCTARGLISAIMEMAGGKLRR